MTSIKNDAFTIGTAAVAAGTANVGYQNRKAVRGIIAPIIDKGTYTDLFEGTQKTVKKAAAKAQSKVKNAAKAAADKLKTIKDPKVTKGLEETISKAPSLKQKLKVDFKPFVNKLTNYSEKSGKAIANFIKNTNWKTVGKYAGIAAAVATAAVIAKNILFDKKDA